MKALHYEQRIKLKAVSQDYSKAYSQGSYMGKGLNNQKELCDPWNGSKTEYQRMF